MAAVMKTATATGSVASFWSPKATNIKSFKIYFDPLQDGRGTPDPENIRPINGQYWIRYYNFPENMLQPVPSSRETYGVVMTTNADGTVEFEGTPSSYFSIKAGYVYLKEGQTALYGKIIGDDDRVSFNTLQLYDDSNTYVAGIATRWEVSTTEDIYAYADLTSYSTATRANINLKRTWNEMYMYGKCFPLIVDSLEKVQSISTDRIKFHFNSKNLFEITSASVYRRGVNWEVRNESVKIIGTPTGTSDFVLGTMDLPEEGGTIVISSTLTDCTNIIWDYCTLNDTNGNVVYSFKETTPNITLNLDNYPSAKTLTLKLRIDQVYVEASGLFRVMVEKGDTPSGEYEPYNTPLYGGYVDLVTGEIWKTHHHYVFTGDETFYTSGSNWVTSFIPSVNGEKMRAYGPSWSGVCTHYPYAPYKQGSIGVMYGENTCIFDYRIRDAEGWKAFAKEQYEAGTPIEVAYLLRDPVLIGTLTPQQLSSLVGRNYYYSNADRVEVEYEYADSPELEVIKKRIALNEPHLGNASGSIANFYTDMASPIKSLKVNFEAKQSGTGDPSPDNIRPITGADQINVYRTGKNLCHIIGYSAKTHSTPLANRATQNNYGTSISTINYTSPDTPLVVTQSSYDESVYPSHYNNGFFVVMLDSLSFGKTYNVSFRVTDILSNPLNVTLSNINIGRPDGSETSPTTVEGDKLIYKNISFNQNRTHDAQYFFIRCCGMSYTMSEFMVTEATEEDRTYEPYTGSIIPCSFSELGTQYGGYVDLVKGELTATHYHLDINTTSIPSMKIYGIYNNYIVIQFGVTENNLPQFVENTQISNRFSKSLPSGTPGRIATTSKYIYMIIPKDDLTGSDIAAIREWFANNPTEVVYELKTPVTYQLTSQQIKTLRGTNNVYSFDGTVDVKYWLHSDVKTERKTAQI